MKKPHVLIPALAYYNAGPDVVGDRYYSQEFVDTLVRARDNARKEGEEKIAKLDREICEYKQAARACPSCSRIRRLEDENKALRAARDEESGKVLALTEERDAAIDVIRSLSGVERGALQRSRVRRGVGSRNLGDALVCPPAEQTKLLEERRHMLDNLTATQRRCTELLEEVRRLKARTPPQPTVRARVIVNMGDDEVTGTVLHHVSGVSGTPTAVWLVKTDGGASIYVFERYIRSAE